MEKSFSESYAAAGVDITAGYRAVDTGCTVNRRVDHLHGGREYLYQFDKWLYHKTAVFFLVLVVPFTAVLKPILRQKIQRLFAEHMLLLFQKDRFESALKTVFYITEPLPKTLRRVRFGDW